MYDDNKVVNQNANPVVQADQTQTQAPVQPSQPVQLAAPAKSDLAPVGSVNKEAGPLTSPVSEFMKPSEAEPQVDQELTDFGIEAKKDAPNVTDEHRDVIDHAKQFTPVPSGSSNSVKLPMSEDEVTDKLKTGQDDDSGKWLAGLIKKIIAAMGI